MSEASVTQIVTLHTSAGDVRINMFGNHAPKTVRNFVELAEGEQGVDATRQRGPRPTTRSTTAPSSTGSSPTS